MQEVLRCFLMIVYKQRAITLTSASSIEVTSHPNFNSKDFMKLSQCSLVYMPSVAVLTTKKTTFKTFSINFYINLTILQHQNLGNSMIFFFQC